VLHARRQETEIMRLVGAPEFVIRLPLLLQGMLQGLIGAAVALAGLAGAHHLVAPRLGPLVNLTLGLADLNFLPPLELAALLVAGTVFGAAGGWLARGRA
jgi:cell division transport system permease protein